MFLDKHLPEPKVFHFLLNTAVFVGAKPAAEFCSVLGTAGNRVILTHDRKRQHASEFMAERAKQHQAVFHMPRKNQMPHKHTSFCGARTGRVKWLQESLDFNHPVESGQSVLRVVPAPHAFFGQFRCGVFDVRHENVDVFSVFWNEIGTLVPGGVENGRKTGVLPVKKLADLPYMQPEMGGRDKVDVVDSQPRQFIYPSP